MNLAERRKEFNSIWGMDISDSIRFDEFKERILNDIQEVIDEHDDDELACNIIDFRYCQLIGYYRPRYDEPGRLQYSKVYRDLKAAISLFEVCNIIQHILWIPDKDKGKSIFSKFINKFIISANMSDVPIVIQKDAEINILPKGAKSLDEGLVYDVYDWLNDYPKAKERYVNAINEIVEGKDLRNIADNLRLSFELFLKQYFGNEKSLENQDIGNYLKQKNVSTNIRTMFVSCISQYAKYNNDHAKHGDNVSEDEIEFLVYITGVFIRTLINLK